jgi:crotonobetainyl-CoA:carnitine CoA-transferase CaiB-like acyl-CoA transferase
VYPTADGRYLAVGALEPRFWRALCGTIGRPDLVERQFAQGTEGDGVRRELRHVFASASLAHWTALFAGVDCCVTPVATLDEAMADPQFIARDMLVTRADGSRGFAPPFKLSGHAFSEARPAPRQGEHTREVLVAAGFDAGAVAVLERDGVVRSG